MHTAHCCLCVEHVLLHVASVAACCILHSHVLMLHVLSHVARACCCTAARCDMQLDAEKAEALGSVEADMDDLADVVSDLATMVQERYWRLQ